MGHLKPTGQNGQNGHVRFLSAGHDPDKTDKPPLGGVPLSRMSQVGSKPGQESGRAALDALDWREHFEERAAILEFDGKRHRVDAEAMALAETVTAYALSHGIGPSRALTALQRMGVGA